MELIDAIKDGVQDMRSVLVDDKGQLTFMGCMCLVLMHLALFETIKEVFKK